MPGFAEQGRSGPDDRRTNRSENSYTPKFGPGDNVHYEKALWTGGGVVNARIIGCVGTVSNGKVTREQCSFSIWERDREGEMRDTGKNSNRSAQGLESGWV